MNAIFFDILFQAPLFRMACLNLLSSMGDEEFEELCKSKRFLQMGPSLVKEVSNFRINHQKSIENEILAQALEKASNFPPSFPLFFWSAFFMVCVLPKGLIFSF